MSNIPDYRLDVLATSPREINRIAPRLKHPSLGWWTGLTASQVRSRDPLRRGGPVLSVEYKARRFKNSVYDRSVGIVQNYLFEVSAEFPNTVFLLEYRDMDAAYSGKMVIRAGDVVQQIFDGDQRAQALDWALLDIFAPFRAEWNEGLQFGSLWAKWVADAKAKLRQLEENIINQQDVKEVAGTSD